MLAELAQRRLKRWRSSFATVQRGEPGGELGAGWNPNKNASLRVALLFDVVFELTADFFHPVLSLARIHLSPAPTRPAVPVSTGPRYALSHTSGERRSGSVWGEPERGRWR